MADLLTKKSCEQRRIEVSKPAEIAGGAKRGGGVAAVDSVADILEREKPNLIQEWLGRVEREPELARIPLSFEERTGHLPQLLHDVIKRLRLDSGTKAPISKAAADHGDLRHKQGYTVAMAVEESRLLQVSIFTTLHQNKSQLEFGTLLPDVVTIADEVDAQLKEQMLRFMAADAAEKAGGK
jgi:RsbT co-antagonist protein rsbRD N-terminal domain